MKKMISISVVALFAFIPTFGWAAFDGVASGSTDERVTETVPTNNSTTTYVTTRSSEADNDLTAAHGFQRAGAGVESIVTSQDPKFNVTQITEDDGEEVAALSFIKGAYNDAITKINKVYEVKEQTSGKFNLNTTWDGGENDVTKVTLITVNKEYFECLTDYYSKFEAEDSYRASGGNGKSLPASDICVHWKDQGRCSGKQVDSQDMYPAIRRLSNGETQYLCVADEGDGYYYLEADNNARICPDGFEVRYETSSVTRCISKTMERCADGQRIRWWVYDSTKWYRICAYEGTMSGTVVTYEGMW